jgi:hypothetical protein
LRTASAGIRSSSIVADVARRAPDAYSTGIRYVEKHTTCVIPNDFELTRNLNISVIPNNSERARNWTPSPHCTNVHPVQLTTYLLSIMSLSGIRHAPRAEIRRRGTLPRHNTSVILIIRHSELVSESRFYSFHFCHS